ncbi:MAG: metal ABC transporter substrate-binding protein [Anaerolineales bacterium]
MKKIIVTIMLVGMLALAACGAPSAAPSPVPTPASETQPQAESVSLRVLAANSFLADIAQNVAGERLTVESLIPIGLDPHAFEPTPQDVAKIANSQALIINGAGFEEWLEKTIENAGGKAKIIEAAAGMDMREPGEDEPKDVHLEDEHEDEDGHDDHSVDSHVYMVCEQLEGEEPEETIQAGADAGNAVEIGHHEDDEDEHGHEREIFSVTLVAQGDDTFGGYLEFDADDEESYAFTTSQAGSISITSEDGDEVEIYQELSLDCGGMAQGLVFKLAPGDYILFLSGFSSETILFSAGEVHGHNDDDDDHHHEGDPHFWLDPNMVIQYVENIRDGLSEIDPDGRETYAQNAANYIEQLRELDTWMRAQVEQIPAERRVLVTDHDTMGYFADQYGFTVIGAIIPSFSTGASPSAQELAGLIDQINDTGAPAIFLDVAANPNLAEQIAGETGVTVVSDLHTHSVTAPDGSAPNYIEMMRHNTMRIVEALK